MAEQSRETGHGTHSAFPSERWLFLPAFLLPVIFLACGWFWAPPQLFSDTATGLLAWRHYAAGGSWNTISEPSTANLAIDVSYPVTWWSCGQYVPLGLLTSAGLSLGAGMLLVSLLSAWSATAGFVLLAHALEAPAAALPWLAWAVAGSWHTLYAFGMFLGGETALMAVLPWIFLAGWQLRAHPFRQALFLPPLLLLGSFAKHSFAIYALGLLGFLWIEAVRRRPRSVRSIATTTLALGAAGVLYVLGRHFAFPAGPTPSDAGQLTRTGAESIGFAAHGPWLAALGGGSLAGRVFQLLGLRFENAWHRLAPLLLLSAPVSLAFYARLAFGRLAIERMAGIVALTTTGILAVLLWRGGGISLEDRHFRPAGLLLLAAFAVAATSNRPGKWVGRGLIAFAVAFGVGAALQRHAAIHRLTFPTADHTSLADVPPAVQAEVRRRDAATGSRDILYLAKAELSPLAHRARLLVTDAINRDPAWLAARSRHGQVPQLTLVVPAAFAQDGRGEALRASFSDYPSTAWTSRSIEGWDFWEAVLPTASQR